MISQVFIHLVTWNYATLSIYLIPWFLSENSRNRINDKVGLATDTLNYT